MYYLDLFSGIGGFALGAYFAGMHFENHYFSEIDKYAIEIYQKRFPGSISLGDIKQIKGETLPHGEWIISGGFPCQDISIAGKGAGLDGERSGLFFEYLRLIDEIQPRYAIMENVGAITIRGLDKVLGSLSEIGYDAEWQDIRASDVGAPHKRERIWIVAYPNTDSKSGITESRKQFERPTQSNRSCINKLESGGKLANADSINDDDTRHGTSEIFGERSEASKISRNFSDSGCELSRSKKNRFNTKQFNCNTQKIGAKKGDGSTNICKNVANANSSGLERRQEYRGRSCKRITREGCKSFIENWKFEPDVGRVANGVSNRVDRLKCLGNSIVPQIAYLIFNEIKGAK